MTQNLSCSGNVYGVLLLLLTIGSLWMFVFFGVLVGLSFVRFGLIFWVGVNLCGWCVRVCAGLFSQNTQHNKRNNHTATVVVVGDSQSR